MKNYHMIINGQLITAEQTFSVINPATEEAFARVPAGDASHLDAAVSAARAAFPAWSALPDAERASKIQALAGLLEKHMPELMELVTLETGKPMAGLNNVGSGMEVGGAMAWAQFTAGLSLPVEVIQDNEDARIELHRKPVGVVGSITPWNWPLMIAIWHVMPALRVGNTVVIKPSENTPVSTLRFVELAQTVLPRGVLNVVTGERNANIGAAMARHPDINKIIFTGSTPTGKNIMGNAAGNLKRLTLELGGNDAAIVLPDVLPQAMAARIFGAAFHNNGQTCACLKRLYVHESIYEELCAELARLAQAAVVGDGLAPGTQLGPVQNAAQLDFITTLAEDARSRGARFLSGGRRLPGKGFFYAPTIVADVTNGMRLVDEEQFGPILPVIKYKEVEEAIRLANDSPFGLGGSVWSSDPAKAVELALRLECGTAWVNEHGAVQPNAPFGGVKQSGFGVEFGQHGLEEYTNIQTVKLSKH